MDKHSDKVFFTDMTDAYSYDRICGMSIVIFNMDINEDEKRILNRVKTELYERSGEYLYRYKNLKPYYTKIYIISNAVYMKYIINDKLQIFAYGTIIWIGDDYTDFDHYQSKIQFKKISQENKRNWLNTQTQKIYEVIINDVFDKYNTMILNKKINAEIYDRLTQYYHNNGTELFHAINTIFTIDKTSEGKYNLKVNFNIINFKERRDFSLLSEFDISRNIINRVFDCNYSSSYFIHNFFYVPIIYIKVEDSIMNPNDFVKRLLFENTAKYLADSNILINNNEFIVFDYHYQFYNEENNNKKKGMMFAYGTAVYIGANSKIFRSQLLFNKYDNSVDKLLSSENYQITDIFKNQPNIFLDMSNMILEKYAHLNKQIIISKFRLKCIQSYDDNNKRQKLNESMYQNMKSTIQNGYRYDFEIIFNVYAQT